MIKTLVGSNAVMNADRFWNLNLRLIDDSHHVQTCDDASILGGLTLGIIEIGRDSHHSMGNLENRTGCDIKTLETNV